MPARLARHAYASPLQPTSSGKLLISVSIGGSPIPGSPYTVVVVAPTPSAPHCLVSGEALTSVVAHRQESFAVSFRDALGQIAYACELDVWVQPIPPPPAPPAPAIVEVPWPAVVDEASIEGDEDGSDGRGGNSIGSGRESRESSVHGGAHTSKDKEAASSDKDKPRRPSAAEAKPEAQQDREKSPAASRPPAQDAKRASAMEPAGAVAELPAPLLVPELPTAITTLLEPLGEFEALVVGHASLDIFSTRVDEEGEWMGQLPPGQQLKLLRIEPMAEDGVLRACVMLDFRSVEGRGQGCDDWREYWPQQQDWRHTEWFEQMFAEIGVEAHGRDKAIAAHLMERELQKRNAAALAIQSVARGRKHRLECASTATLPLAPHMRASPHPPHDVPPC